MISLSSLPIDILLEIVKNLPIADAISFSATCTTLRSLAQQRSFWIPVLESYRSCKPLTCPAHDDISKHDIDSLRKMAFLRKRLDYNWNRPFPRIVGRVGTIQCESPVSIISFAPGTDIIILHFPENRTAECWDLVAGGPCPLPPVPLDDKILAISQPYEAVGMYNIAVLTENEDDERSIHVLCTMHENGNATSFTGIFHLDLCNAFFYDDVFLYEDVVGVIRKDNQQPKDHYIVAYNMNSRETVVLTKISHNLILVGCNIFAGHLYVFTEEKEALRVYRCPRSALPYGTPPPWPRTIITHWIIDGPYIGDPRDVDDGDIALIPGTPSFGVSTVSTRHFYARHEGVLFPFTSVRFWPNTVAPDAPESPLAFKDAIGLTTRLLGKIALPVSLPYLLFVSHSGANVLVATMYNRVRALQLVRYNREQHSTSVHELRMPPSVDLRTIINVAIDDFRGVVILLDRNGLLFRIPYA